MSDLTEFLLREIAEREAVARMEMEHPLADPPDLGWVEYGPGHALTVDPARVLADCEALRAVVALHDPVDPCDAHNASFETVPCDTLLALAQPFAGRPGWDESWRIDGHKEAQA